MKLKRNDAHRGYTPLYAETLDTSTEFKGNFSCLYVCLFGIRCNIILLIGLLWCLILFKMMK